MNAIVSVPLTNSYKTRLASRPVGTDRVTDLVLIPSNEAPLMNFAVLTEKDSAYFPCVVLTSKTNARKQIKWKRVFKYLI